MKAKKTANSVTLASGQDLSKGSVSRGKDRHFSTKLKKNMELIVFTLIGFLLCGTAKEQHYILDNVKAEYFADPMMAEIYCAARAVDAKNTEINMMTVMEAMVTDSDSDDLAKRMKVFRQYYHNKGDLPQDATDAEVKSHIMLTLANINTPSASCSVESATRSFMVDYVQRASQATLIEFGARAKESPQSDFSEALAAKLHMLNALLDTSSWTKYAIDFQTLEKSPEKVALVSRRGQSFFYRGNIYLISGLAGTMKSYLCLSIAAAVLNQGRNADKTLCFSGISSPLKLLYVDSELAENTILKRWQALKKMVPSEIDMSTYQYLSLLKVSAGITEKRRIVDEACRHYHPDVIIMDSGRDLCYDFNDNREADELVAHFKLLATELDAVVICTSHQALSAGNAKGHFGMRFNEAAGLEMALKKGSDFNGEYIEVQFTKQREDHFEPFKIKFDPELGYLTEYAPLVDHTEERRQIRAARVAIEAVLMPGDAIAHSVLVGRLCGTAKGPTGAPISQKTARNYIAAAIGNIIVKTDDGKYTLITNGPTIGFPSDEEDMPEEICDSAPA